MPIDNTEAKTKRDKKLKLLKKYHRRACGNLFLASVNHAMTKAKPGREEEWQEAMEEVEFLEAWVAEMGGRIYER